MQLHQVSVVKWENGECVLLDQTRLPSQEIYVRCQDYRSVVHAIRDLVVRGAPAIGIAGAYGVVLAAQGALNPAVSNRAEFFEKAVRELALARPTGANLKWAVERMKRAMPSPASIDRGTVELLLTEAQKIHAEDFEANKKIGLLGAELLPPGGSVMTYCNAGHLATGGHGTALGVVYTGYQMGKVKGVYTCETRPILQGLRLTVWELNRSGVPFTVICDNMAATVMSQKKIGAVVVGADRIARNGDVANKVGTFSVALAAHYHGIPFFVAAPSSTFDLRAESGKDFEIEERSKSEILDCLGGNQPPFSVLAFNPAFDITPHHLITAIISEKGVHRPRIGSQSVPIEV